MLVKVGSCASNTSSTWRRLTISSQVFEGESIIPTIDFSPSFDGGTQFSKMIEAPLPVRLGSREVFASQSESVRIQMKGGASAYQDEIPQHQGFQFSPSTLLWSTRYNGSSQFERIVVPACRGSSGGFDYQNLHDECRSAIESVREIRTSDISARWPDWVRG